MLYEEKELLYKHIINRIGIALLILFGLLTALSSIQGIVSQILYTILNPVAAYTVSELIYVVIYLASFIVPALILQAMMGKNRQPIMLKMSLPRNSFAYIFMGIGAILAISYINAVFVSIFNYSEFSSDVIWGNEPLENYQIVLSFISTAMVPGICEEFFFRGAILSSLKPFGKAPAIVISAVLFGLMHQNAEQFLFTTAAGIVLGWIAFETGSVWCGILLHFLNNYFSVVQSWLYDRLPYEIYSFVSPIITIVLFAVAVICTVYLIKFHEKKKQSTALLADGIFGKEPESVTDFDTPAIRLRPGRLSRLFFSPTIIIFIVISFLSMALLILQSIIYSVSGTL